MYLYVCIYSYILTGYEAGGGEAPAPLRVRGQRVPKPTPKPLYQARAPPASF